MSLWTTLKKAAKIVFVASETETTLVNRAVSGIAEIARQIKNRIFSRASNSNRQTDHQPSSSTSAKKILHFETASARARYAAFYFVRRLFQITGLFFTQIGAVMLILENITLIKENNDIDMPQATNIVIGVFTANAATDLLLAAGETWTAMLPFQSVVQKATDIEEKEQSISSARSSAIAAYDFELKAPSFATNRVKEILERLMGLLGLYNFALLAPPLRPAIISLMALGSSALLVEQLTSGTEEATGNRPSLTSEYKKTHQTASAIAAGLSLPAALIDLFLGNASFYTIHPSRNGGIAAGISVAFLDTFLAQLAAHQPQRSTLQKVANVSGTLLAIYIQYMQILLTYRGFRSIHLPGKEQAIMSLAEQIGITILGVTLALTTGFSEYNRLSAASEESSSSSRKNRCCCVFSESHEKPERVVEMSTLSDPLLPNDFCTDGRTTTLTLSNKS